MFDLLSLDDHRQNRSYIVFQVKESLPMFHFLGKSVVKCLDEQNAITFSLFFSK